ncbi:hypothetical protein KQI86_04895 [Clostridium sp. MSJ-11]|uniref:Uncharacterized protein n=1 Tax=Clostridium mobile TaxID=2841512 RepID=A0ABS6EES8_9CLOT|nr:hypothetical protein [Clostridium mobile]MBU5483657.1 hypothetical protein [Clostridium mobile]
MSLDQWIDRYCRDKNITYDELVEEALKHYRTYEEDGKSIEKYVNSEEFKKVVKNLYKIIFQKNSWRIYAITNTKDKEEFYNKFNCDIIINSFDNSIDVLRVYHEDNLNAYVLISYEYDSFGKYSFLHKIFFQEGAHIKNYSIIEELTCKYIKAKGFSYLDRILYTKEVESIEKIGYYLLENNLNVKVLLNDNNESNKIDYKVTENEKSEETYEIISNITPKRLIKPLDKWDKIILGKNMFFLNYKIFQDKALVYIYIRNVFENLDREELKNMYDTIIDIFINKNIKYLYTFIPSSHIMLLDKNNIEILNNIIWIRKNIGVS